MELASLWITLGLQKGDFDSQTEKAASSIERVGKSAQGTDGPLNGMTRNISASTIALGQLIAKAAEWAFNAAKDLAAAGWNYNQQMEDYTTNFKVMLGGNLEAAEAKIAELSDFAAHTPFGLGDLTEATQTLLAFGVSAETSTGILRMLGDISLGNADKMKRLSTAFGKASASGKVTGEVIQSMTDAGFNPLLVLSEKTGESMDSLRDRMSKGKLSVAELEQAMIYATSEGGQFFGGMEEASKTVSGMTSTLTDNWTRFLGTLTAPFYNVYKDSILPKLLEAVDSLNTWATSESVQDGLSKIEGFLNGIFNAEWDWNKIKTSLNITLDSFGLPSVDDMATKLNNWWNGEDGNSGVWGKAKEYFKALITIDTDGDGNVTRKDLETWFHNVVSKAGAVFSVAVGIDKDGDGAINGKELGEWFKGVVKSAGDVFNVILDVIAPADGSTDAVEIGKRIFDYSQTLLGEVGDFFTAVFGVDNPSDDENTTIVKQIKTWWRERILTKLGLRLGFSIDVDLATGDKYKVDQTTGKKVNPLAPSNLVQIFGTKPAKVDVEPQTVPNSTALMESQLNKNPPTVEVKPWLDLSWLGVGNWRPFGGNATGLDYVPRDNFPTYLHKGEAVLDANDAAEYRRGENGSNVDFSGFVREIVGAISGLTVQMDSETVGVLVSPAVDAELGRRNNERRYY